MNIYEVNNGEYCILAKSKADIPLSIPFVDISKIRSLSKKEIDTQIVLSNGEYITDKKGSALTIGKMIEGLTKETNIAEPIVLGSTIC